MLLDSAPLGGNVIYTFHFYEPYVFSPQGAPWMSGEPMYCYLNAVPWPSSGGSRRETLAAAAARMAADHATPDSEKRAIMTTIERVLTQYFDARPDRRFIEKHFRASYRMGGAARDRPQPHPARRVRRAAQPTSAMRRRLPPIARYIRDVRETAGMPRAFWNLFDGMGLMTNDASRQFDPAILAALGLRT